MNYKKIIKSQQLRFGILKALSFVPDAWMLRLQYWVKMGRWLDLKNPKRFTEKLQWYKLYWRDPVMGICVDKYRVREYVESKGLGHILNKLYGVYDDVSEIDFDALPRQFVIKTTDGGGGQNVFICKDKSKVDWTESSKEIATWKDRKEINAGREWAYTQMPKSRYIVEQYIDAGDNIGGLIDYKFFCFNGEVECLYIIADRDLGTDCGLGIFRKSFEKIDAVRTDEIPLRSEMSKPQNFSEMVDLAEMLAKDFPHVRIDMYNVNGKIIFGEFTFYDGSGYQVYSPDSFDFTLGDQFLLPEKKLSK